MVRDSIKRFDFLDCYRGMAVLFVICSHVDSAASLYFSGFFTAVTAFFQLSAFLLIYRLLIALESPKTPHDSQSSLIIRVQHTFRIFLRYAVVRFCRIYLTFAIFLGIQFLIQSWLMKPSETYAHQAINGLLLRGKPLADDGNFIHLWTMPIEVSYSAAIRNCLLKYNLFKSAKIAYYNVIPIMALILSCFKKKWQVIWLFVVTVVISMRHMIIYRRYLSSTPSDHNAQTVMKCLPIFLMGSLVAFFYKRVEDYNINHMLAEKRPKIAYALACVSVFMQIAIIRLPFFFNYTGNLLVFYINGLIMALHLFLLLVGAPNMLTEWMSSSWILRTMGKLSFGAYLVHMLMFKLVQSREEWLGKIASVKLNSQEFLLITLITCFTFAYVFYHTVETSMIKLANFVNRCCSNVWCVCCEANNPI